jgi:ABC-type transport system substrate-binding protein
MQIQLNFNLTIDQNTLNALMSFLGGPTVKVAPGVSEAPPEELAPAGTPVHEEIVEPPEQPAEPDREAVKARLKELGVAYTDRQKTTTLLSKLEVAETVAANAAAAATQPAPSASEVQPAPSASEVQPAPSVKGPGLAEVREVLKAFAQTRGEVAAINMLKTFGATKLSEVPAEKYQIFYDTLKGGL